MRFLTFTSELSSKRYSPTIYFSFSSKSFSQGCKISLKEMLFFLNSNSFNLFRKLTLFLTLNQFEYESSLEHFKSGLKCSMSLASLIGSINSSEYAQKLTIIL